jgi:hypothetical protein
MPRRAAKVRWCDPGMVEEHLVRWLTVVLYGTALS